MWKFVKTTVLALGLWGAVLGAHAQTCGLRDNGDGTMTDPETKLSFQKCRVGQQWSGSTCTGKDNAFNWNDAVARYGSGTWRLITVAESRQVGARSKGCFALPPDSYGNMWTSSPAVGDQNSAVTTYFGGGDELVDRGYQRPIRLVRSN